MNIREGHCLASLLRQPIRDLHFRVDGPVVSQIQESFVDDWSFCTGEILGGDCWFPPIASKGGNRSRGGVEIF